MPYCSRCGVEVEQGVKKCPLCKTPIQKLEGETFTKYDNKYPDVPVEEPSKPKMTEKEKRMRAWEIVSVSIVIPIMIAVFTNLIIDANVTWAKYPMMALLLVWLLTTFPLTIPRRPFMLAFAEVMSLLTFLVLVDYLHDQTINWFLELALPIIIIFILSAALVLLGILTSKIKGINIAAFILFGLGIFNLGVDLAVTNHIYGGYWPLTWSLFVLVPTFIIGGFLL